MPDYKELYLKLFRATEAAIDLLIAAQRECEELYLSAPEEAEEADSRPLTPPASAAAPPTVPAPEDGAHTPASPR